MKLKDVQRLELPPSADMHVHLRQDQVNLPRPLPVLDWTGLMLFLILQVMELVVPQIRKGGVDTVFVMARRPPNMSVCHSLTWLIAKLTAAYYKCSSSSGISLSPTVY